MTNKHSAINSQWRISQIKGAPRNRDMKMNLEKGTK